MSKGGCENSDTHYPEFSPVICFTGQLMMLKTARMWEQPPASPSPVAAHLSPVNGLLQQAHHVLSLAARCLETFCPLQENSLLWEKSPSESPSIAAERHSQGCCQEGWSYLIQVVLLAREREGESERERYTLHSHVLQEVGDAVDNVVKELDKQSQEEKLAPQPEPSWKPACPKLLRIPTHSRAYWNVQIIPRTLNRAGQGSAALWEVSTLKKLSFTLFPIHSVDKLCIVCTLQVPGGVGPSREVTQESDPSARDPHSPPAQPAGDTPVPKHCLRGLQNFFEMCLWRHLSLLVLWFPYLGNGDDAYLPLWSVWDSGRYSHVWE